MRGVPAAAGREPPTGGDGVGAPGCGGLVKTLCASGSWAETLAAIDDGRVTLARSSPVALFDERRHPAADVVADLPHALDRLAFGIVELPVPGLEAGQVGALLPASHRHQPAGALRQLRRQPLGAHP